SRKLKFLICVYHDRTVSSEGSTMGLLKVGEAIPLPYQMDLTRRKHVGRKGVAKEKFTIRYGASEVALPETWDRESRERSTLNLWLIAVEGFDRHGKRALFLR